MLHNQKLKDREFIGKILVKEKDTYYIDPKRQGRYRVHLPDLMPHIPPEKGIWCKNHVHSWRITNSNIGEYGSYFPLQDGTTVLVSFFDDDPNTGRIVSIISDYVEGSNVEAQDCLETISEPTDRDEQYIIFKTPKYWNSLYINEDTAHEPNTIYLIYNRDNLPERRTVYRINECGVHFYTRDNHRVRILGDENIQIDENKTENIFGYRTTHVTRDEDLHVHGSQIINVDKNQDQWIIENRTINIDEDDYLHTVGVTHQLLDDDKEVVIKGARTITISKNNDIHISLEWKQKADLNTHLKAGINFNIEAGAEVHIKSLATIKMDSSYIFMNSQMASSATDPEDCEYPIEIGVDVCKSDWSPDGLVHADKAKPSTHVRDLGPDETEEWSMKDRLVCDRPVVVEPEEFKVIHNVDSKQHVTGAYNFSPRPVLPKDKGRDGDDIFD